jgi:hypothetical protein
MIINGARELYLAKISMKNRFPQRSNARQTIVNQPETTKIAAIRNRALGFTESRRIWPTAFRGDILIFNVIFFCYYHKAR